MAEAGQTFQYLRYGYSPLVAEAVRLAVQEKMGFRRLPRRMWQFPFRPYDVRRYWKEYPQPSEYYKEEFEIPKEEAESLPEVPETSGETRYTARLVVSLLSNEGLCFVSRSTIEDAGFGLFLRSRKPPIHKGDSICKYSSKKGIDDSSSRVYAVQTGKGWFDADTYDGTNVGRFANQKGVKETLQLALVQAESKNYVSMDWKVVNDYASTLANAKFEVVQQELHIVAKDDIAPSTVKTEIFVSYGLTQNYWIPLVASCPGDYPECLSSCVRWLLTSPQSNWTRMSFLMSRLAASYHLHKAI